MRRILVAAAVGSISILGAYSFAAPQKTEEVRVEASRIVKQDVGRTPTGIPLKEYSLSYEVSLDDLDLASSAGLAAANKRVNNAALEACKEIGKAAPYSRPNDDECAAAAAKPAIEKIRQAAASAGNAAAK